MLVQRIASVRNPSVTVMNLVEALLAMDEVPAYVTILWDKAKTERHPSYSMIRRLMALTS